MSKTFDPTKSLSEDQMVEITKEEFREYLRERITLGIETAECLNLFHCFMQKVFTDEYGNNPYPVFYQTYTKEEMSPNLGNVKRINEDMGFKVVVIYDPTEKAEPKRVAEPTNILDAETESHPSLNAESVQEANVPAEGGDNAKTPARGGRRTKKNL